MWVGVTDIYMSENCMPGGTLKTHNLDSSERIGLAKLKKRVQAGEIVVIPADKGSQFTVSPQESFSRQGDSHTEKDRKIDDKELEQVQARMNSLSQGLTKVTGVGACWGDKNTARCWNNLITDACVAHLLYPSPKVHKPVDGMGDSKSCPIVQASSCVTSRPGEILADVLEAALLSFLEQQECQSTEDMLAKVDKVDVANGLIRESAKDVCVGSGDCGGIVSKPQAQRECRDCMVN